MSETAIKPMINGIEVKAGQRWKNYSGATIRVTEVFMTGVFEDNRGFAYDRNGESLSGCSEYNLRELVEDVEPHTPSLESTFQQLNKEFDNLNTALDSVFNACACAQYACKNSASKQDKKHSHYFKDVSHLDTIDIYRVLQLYNVTNPCQQHAAKKVLLAGGRGGKDYLKDIQEAIDTLERLKDMLKEDERINNETKE